MALPLTITRLAKTWRRSETELVKALLRAEMTSDPLIENLTYDQFYFLGHWVDGVREMEALAARLKQPQGPTTIALSGAAVKVNVKGRVPSFTALAYSGMPVSGRTATPPQPHPYVLDLAGMSAHRAPKVNLNHKPSERVGHITSFSNDGKQIILKGLLSAATPHRDEVVASARDGYTWEVSIEASMILPRHLRAGESEVVNGRSLQGPLTIYGKSELFGVAFVPQGADVGNYVSVAAAKGE